MVLWVAALCLVRARLLGGFAAFAPPSGAARFACKGSWLFRAVGSCWSVALVRGGAPRFSAASPPVRPLRSGCAPLRVRARLWGRGVAGGRGVRRSRPRRLLRLRRLGRAPLPAAAPPSLCGVARGFRRSPWARVSGFAAALCCRLARASLAFVSAPCASCSRRCARAVFVSARRVFSVASPLRGSL